MGERTCFKTKTDEQKVHATTTVIKKITYLISEGKRERGERERKRELETEDGITLHAPLLLWLLSFGTDSFILSFIRLHHSFFTNTPQLGYSTIYLAVLMLIDFCFQLLTLTNKASMNFPT